MRLLILFLLFPVSAWAVQDSTTDQQSLDQLRQQLIETMRKEGPAKAGEVVQRYLDTSSDAKAVFYLAWTYFNEGKFDDAELFARPLTANTDPSLQAAANLLLGKIYSRVQSPEDNPVYFLTAALLISQEHKLFRVEYQTHLSLCYWYTNQQQHDLSDLHLRKAQMMLRKNDFDRSQYYLQEFHRFMSLGAYRDAHKSALQMYEDSDGQDYQPYFAINLAMAQILMKEFEQAKSTLETAKKVLASRNDTKRQEIIAILFEAMDYCQGRKNALQDDSIGTYSIDSDVPHNRMMGRYIQMIYDWCQ